MRQNPNCSHTSMVLLSAYSRSAPHLARISCNAPGETVGLRRSRVGEDTQADIPQISEVKLRFFHSRRNTIGRSSSPYRPHRSLPHVALVRPYSLDACALETPAVQHRRGPGRLAPEAARRCGTVSASEPMLEVFDCEARRSPIDLAEHDVQ